MVSRARAVQRRWWSGLVVSDDKLEQAAARLADNLKYCSCGRCCSRRHATIGGQTRGERIQRLDLAEALGVSR